MTIAVDLAWAGWPLALGLAASLAAARIGQRRRTETLNRALHELRRPLQALALGAGPGRGANGNGPPPLELAICALGDLDRVINGEPALPARRLLRLRPVVEACVERWVGVAELAGCRLDLEWRAGAAAVVADPHRVAQALDNLVLNAIEHGSPPIEVGVVTCDRGVRIAVEDRGRSTGAVRPRHRLAGHRGRGLQIVASVAAEHGGSFAIRRGPSGTAAVLELPLASLPLPALATASAA